MSKIHNFWRLRKERWRVASNWCHPLTRLIPYHKVKLSNFCLFVTNTSFYWFMLIHVFCPFNTDQLVCTFAVWPLFWRGRGVSGFGDREGTCCFVCVCVHQLLHVFLFTPTALPTNTQLNPSWNVAIKLPVFLLRINKVLFYCDLYCTCMHTH